MYSDNLYLLTCLVAGLGLLLGKNCSWGLWRTLQAPVAAQVIARGGGILIGSLVPDLFTFSCFSPHLSVTTLMGLLFFFTRQNGRVARQRFPIIGWIGGAHVLIKRNHHDRSPHRKWLRPWTSQVSPSRPVVEGSWRGVREIWRWERRTFLSLRSPVIRSLPSNTF